MAGSMERGSTLAHLWLTREVARASRVPRKPVAVFQRLLSYGRSFRDEDMVGTEVEGRPVTRFGGFELDLRSGELSKQGVRIRLQHQPVRILELLLERHGDVVTRDELRQVLWPGDTFVDFDGGLNTAVNKLRAALGDSAESPRFVETVGRRGYRLIASVEPAKVTPDPGALAATPTAAAPAAPDLPPRGRHGRLAVALAGAALVAALAGIFWPNREPAPTPATIRSLAVLPLASLSSHSEDDYFADGITEALITRLAGIRSMRVISRQSVMRYKKSNKSLPEIARELGVDAVVEGSVTRSTGRVRVTAQLVLAPADRHLWARSYERDLVDVLALQAEVAAAIAGEVRATLTAPDRARLGHTRPVDPEAYDLYLRGRYFFNQRFQGDAVPTISKSVDYLEKAITKDPQFALAHAALGEAYGPFGHWAPIAPAEARARRSRAAARALELDPDLEQAHTARSAILEQDWDWRGSEQELQRALELNPDYTLARFWYSLLLSKQERFEEALEQTELGLAIDPFDPTLSSNNAAVLANLGRHQEGIGRLRRFLELEPSATGARRTLAGIYARLDGHEAATREFETAGLADGVARVRAFQGKTTDLRRILRGLEDEAGRQYVSPITFASVYATLGDREQALAHLARAADTKAVGLLDVVTAARFTPCFSSPTMGKEFDFLRADPRFAALRRRMKLE
jgi:TolB-like protein/DNA-binding winged helix-turn-helix (wHTH) protein/tetratricopeptide (TPR) repeat protein